MNDIRLFQLNQYIRPTIQENKAKNWVLNGRNNDFYQYIIDRYNGSPTNAAIINSYIDLVYGKGLYSKNSRENLSNWIHFLTTLKPKETKKIIHDFVLFGEASFQVVKTKGGDISSINHIPKDKVVPSIENENGEIEGYWYSKNWQDLNKNKPEFYPAFGTSKEAIEIYVIKPYKAGKNYFSDPFNMAALPYCEIEEELSNFYLNSIKKGLSAGYIINVPDGNSLTPEEKEEFEKKIKAKLTGSPNALSFVLSFNGRDADITITPFPVNEQQHKQWEYLTSEARQQIMTGWRVTSPMLFGIKDNTGFGNNAEELDTAESQLMKRVIQPMQQHIIDAFTEVVEFYNINVDLAFKPLTEAPKNEPIQMAEVCCSSEKKKYSVDDIIALGEDIDLNEWELVESKKVDYSEEIYLASTGVANPNAKDSTDGELFKSRYRYTGGLGSNSREFCTKMINANKLYRKDDIDRMSKNPVNAGWGPNGADTYDIFLYKGGGDCHHYWTRETYRKKTDVNSPLAEQITPATARKEGEILPVNDKKVYTKPKDMPYNGYLPTNKRFK
jgi:hypothetical protein